MSGLGAREGEAFELLAETLLAPAAPLPPVAETDARQAFEAWLDRAPRTNRLALRAALRALDLLPRLGPEGLPLRRLDADQRLAVLRRVERSAARPVLEALRAVTAMSYYGDPRVSAIVGYSPGSLAGAAAAARAGSQADGHGDPA